MTPGFTSHPEGSVLIEAGATRVLCAASVEDGVPAFLRDSGKGWVTAEYAMLPRSTHTRSPRERTKIGGRTQEIQRLVGRSLRAVTDLDRVGERTITVDCDVLQADGGTRTAAITGGFVALGIAFRGLVEKGELAEIPLRGAVAAVSAGIVDGRACVDLCYEEDHVAEVDMNFVMTDQGRFVEVQGTAEAEPFSREQLDELADLAWAGIRELLELQKRALSE